MAINKKEVVSYEGGYAELSSDYMFKRLPVMSYRISPDGRIIDVNEVALNKLGYDNKDQLTGEDFVIRIYDPDYHEKARKLFKKWKENGRLTNERMKVVTRHGDRIAVLLNADTLKDAKGSVISSLSTHIEINDLNIYENDIEDYEGLTRAIVDNSPDCIKILDTEGKLEFMSKGGQGLLEIEDISTYLGKSWVDFWCDDCRNDVINAIEEAKNKGQGYFEGFCPTTKGTPKWWGVTISPLLDDNGKVTNLLAVSRDITIRKESETKRKEQENYYRSLLFSLHEDILVIDRDYTITDINNTALKTLGLKRDEVVGRKCYEISHGIATPCDENGETCSLKKVLDEGANCNVHHEHIAKNGEIRHVDILMSPLYDKYGNITSVIEATRDVTDLFDASQALNITETKFKTLFENTPNPVMELNENGRIIDVNQATQEFLEHPDYEVHGKNILDLFEDEERIRDHLKRVHNGKTESIEVHYAIRGVMKTLLVNIIPFISDGNIRIYWIGQEITDLKEKEEQIRSSKGALDAVLDLSPLPMWVSDRDGNLIRTNNSLLRTMKIKKENVLEKYNVFEDMNLEREGVMSEVRRVFEDHEYVRFKIHWKADEGGTDFTGARDMFIDVSMFPILDVRGKLKNVICQWVDITNLKRIENKLKQREAFLTTLLNAIPAPVFYKDREGRYQGVNRAFQEFFGASEEEIRGKTAFDINPEHLAKFFRAKDEELLKEGGVLTYETKIKNANDIYRNVIIHKDTFRDLEENIKGFIGVILDITDRKNAEKSIKKEKERAEFYLDLLGHDLGNIHQGLEGSLELMGMMMDDRERLEKILKIAKEAVYNSINLTKEIMLLSRIENDEPELERIDLESTIDDSLKVIKRIFSEKEIENEMDLKVASIMAEPIIKEVFTNLLHNAVRLQEKDPWVRIESRKEKKRTILTVSDKGPGIPDEMKKDLFKKFGMKSEMTRTGLGLTIVKALVERYNGTISVADRVKGDHSRGAKFVMRFPCD